MPHTNIKRDEIAERIGRNLKEARTQAGMSPKHLAHQCRMSLRALRYYESGERTKFEGIALLIRAAAAMNVSFSDLIGTYVPLVTPRQASEGLDPDEVSASGEKYVTEGTVIARL